MVKTSPGIISMNKHKVMPNGSVVVGAGLFKTIRKNLKRALAYAKKHKLASKSLAMLAQRTSNPYIAVLSAAARTAGLGKRGAKVYKIQGGGAYVMGGSIFSKLRRYIRKGARTVAKQAKKTYKRVKSIRKPSDVISLARDAKSLTDLGDWGVKGLKAVGMGKRRKATLGGRKRRARRPATQMIF